MKVTRKSMLTGIVRTIDIDVTARQLEAWRRGEVIQDAMPNLTDAEREFLISGATQEEWANAFPDE